jgi:hypothetical protein
MLRYRRRRSNPNRTPLQISVQKDCNRAEIKAKIIANGIAKALRNFYGNADDMFDILDIANRNLGDSVREWKAQELYLEKVSKNKSSWATDKRNKKRSKVN